ncbi:MAG: hypothetical protein K9L84_02190 [Candidatus Omnitrophica bacterium]|nr:hypothetical protein [Candidatus Omnitrophota bacterium]MCF7893851.1 hypothetical protein [Candidatus Omnitrophota bacterium]
MEVELKDYQKHLEEKEKEWESFCLRCGACCGAYDDPCTHLQKDQTGKFYCDIYPDRFGVRKTVSGHLFKCVSIKKMLQTHWKGDHLCPYKKLQKNCLGI